MKEEASPLEDAHHGRSLDLFGRQEGPVGGTQERRANVSLERRLAQKRLVEKKGPGAIGLCHCLPRRSGRPTVGIFPTPRVSGTREAPEDWREDRIDPCCIEEDLQKFEEAERETQDKLQMPFCDEKEVDQPKNDMETICERWIFLEEVQRPHNRPTL